MDSLDDLLGDLLLLAESLEASLDAPPAPDHADVLCRAMDNLAQTRLVVFVAPGDEDDIRRGGDRYSLQRLRHIAHLDVIRVRKPLPVGELQAVVQHGHMKIQNLGHLDQGNRDMARTDHDQLRRSGEHLEKDLDFIPGAR